jgi:hypothetical protein
MKKLLTKIIAVSSVALLMLSACKKDGTLVVANSGTPGALTATTTSPTLSSANLTSSTPVIGFNFTKGDYGYNGAITNTLQIDAPGDNWANPYTVALGTSTFSQTFNTADFNNILLKLGLKGGISTTVNVRISQSIGLSVTPVYSNVIVLNTTPFNLKSWIYVVGAFQGWNAANPDSLLSATGNNIYTGIINFTAGNNQFLILPQKNSYNNKIATTNSTTPSSTTQVNASNNLAAPSAAGQYIVTYNATANTITFALANYYSLIGSSPPGNAWSTDSDMKYINDGSQTWTATVAMTAGAFKVRENHDWTYSWGDISPADGTNATDNNGGNINISVAGNYTVTFTIPLSAQSATFTPSVLATYTLKKN